MKILFLGTGAADWPLERPANAAEFRRLSSAVIDGCLLIDPGPQVLDALKEHSIAPTSIRYILNTHKHFDHYCQETVDALTAAGAQYIHLAPGTEKEVGPFTVYAYQGNHGDCKATVHYILCRDGKSMFYGLDGSWLLYEEVDGIKQHRPDLAVLDGTVGFVDGDCRIFGHNNLRMVLEIKKTLSPYVKSFCISHMAMTLHTDHATLENDMAQDSILVARDGMQLII